MLIDNREFADFKTSHSCGQTVKTNQKTNQTVIKRFTLLENEVGGDSHKYNTYRWNFVQKLKNKIENNKKKNLG